MIEVKAGTYVAKLLKDMENNEMRVTLLHIHCVFMLLSLLLDQWEIIRELPR